MDRLRRSPAWYYLIKRSLERLDEAQNALRHVVLFAYDPKLEHSLIQADAFIRQAISALKGALPTREE
jgi:hypothetical protein